MIGGGTARLWLLRGQEGTELRPALVRERRESFQPQGSRWVHRYRGGLPCATQPMEVLSSPLVLASKVRPVQSSGLPFLRLTQRLQ